MVVCVFNWFGSALVGLFIFFVGIWLISYLVVWYWSLSCHFYSGFLSWVWFELKWNGFSTFCFLNFRINIIFSLFVLMGSLPLLRLCLCLWILRSGDISGMISDRSLSSTAKCSGVWTVDLLLKSASKMEINDVVMWPYILPLDLVDATCHLPI